MLRTQEKKTHYEDTISLSIEDIREILDGQLVYGRVVNATTGKFLGRCNMEVVMKTIKGYWSDDGYPYAVAKFK